MPSYPLFHENLDAATPPTLPATLETGSANITVVNTPTISSATNSIRGSDTAAISICRTVSNDTNAGDVTSSVYLQTSITSSYNISAYARTNTSNTFPGTLTGYLAIMVGGTAYLESCVAGTNAVLASVAISGGNIPVTPILFELRCLGTSIKVRFRRKDNGQWLNSTGTWQAGAVDCMAITNAAVSGAGRTGAGFSVTAGNFAYADDFYIDPAALSMSQSTAAMTAGGATVTLTAGGFSDPDRGSHMVHFQRCGGNGVGGRSHTRWSGNLHHHGDRSR